jgi:hypothetical protein
MQFLVKHPDSPLRNATYTAKGHNDDLRLALLEERLGFCAYTERRVDRFDDTLAVEHFDPRLKGTDADGYLNLYAVLQSQNQRKRRNEARFANASFFDTRFFQDAEQLDARITYVPGEFVYEEQDLADTEAADLLEYLDVNVEERVKRRRKHARRLAGLFRDAGYDTEQQRKWLAENPEEWHYPTVLKAELEIDVLQLDKP